MAQREEFTKYEMARILGARALQIAMDAPILLKMTEDDLKEINYDSLKIAEKEIEAGVLPISVYRPMPGKIESKLAIKEEKIDDQKIIEKEKEIEDEIKENAEEMGFAQEDDADEGQGDEENKTEE